MLTQQNKPRQAGPAFYAYIEQKRLERFGSQALSADAATPHVRENTKHSEKNTDSRSKLAFGKLAEGGKEARRDGSVAPTHASALLSSYKAQNPKFPHAAHQNPNNDPYVALLLERYGDIRGVIKHSPIFETPLAKYEDGGWNIGFGAMVKAAAHDYTLDRVLWAIKAVKNDRSARDRGKLFFYALKNGLEEL